MRPTLVCALVLAVSSIPAVGAAEGTRFTAGVDLGLTQASKDADYNDANHTLGLFGRMIMTSRLSGQIELTKLDTDDSTVSMRVYSVLVTVDLANGGHWMPMLLAGVGLDRMSTDYGVYTNAHHIEGGIALEYRADGGFVAGADIRLGGRSIDSESQILYADDGPTVAAFAPAVNIPEGEYRSARLYMGVHF